MPAPTQPGPESPIWDVKPLVSAARAHVERASVCIDEAACLRELNTARRRLDAAIAELRYSAKSPAQVDAVLDRVEREAAAGVAAYPCVIEEADFEKNTVTLKMDGAFVVCAGRHLLVGVARA